MEAIADSGKNLAGSGSGFTDPSRETQVKVPVSLRIEARGSYQAAAVLEAINDR